MSMPLFPLGLYSGGFINGVRSLTIFEICLSAVYLRLEILILISCSQNVGQFVRSFLPKNSAPSFFPIHPIVWMLTTEYMSVVFHGQFLTLCFVTMVVGHGRTTFSCALIKSRSRPPWGTHILKMWQSPSSHCRVLSRIPALFPGVKLKCYLKYCFNNIIISDCVKN